MRFWDVVKEVSTQPVRQEAERLFVLALAGDPEAVAEARCLAFGAPPTLEQLQAAEPFLPSFSPPYSAEAEQRLRHADLIVSLPGGPSVTDFRPADTVTVRDPRDLIPTVLARRPDLRVALGRRLPGFRPLASDQVIREVSRANAEFATLSGISQSIPLLAPFFPAVAGADILVLTKNQILMTYRLAALYGEDLTFRARSREVLGIIGGAFGWRTLARQFAGILPAGLGLPVRAGIAFSGTYTVGRAAQMLFDEGRRPTRAEMLRIYDEGKELARETVIALRDRFRKQETLADSEAKGLPQPATLSDPNVIDADARVEDLNPTPEPEARPEDAR